MSKQCKIEVQTAGGYWQMLTTCPNEPGHIKQNLDSFHRSRNARVRAIDSSTGTLIDMRG